MTSTDNDSLEMTTPGDSSAAQNEKPVKKKGQEGETFS
jgi:hypothetical protein